MGNLDSNNNSKENEQQINAETRRIPKNLIEEQIKKAQIKHNTPKQKVTKNVLKENNLSKTTKIDKNKVMLAGKKKDEELIDKNVSGEQIQELPSMDNEPHITQHNMSPLNTAQHDIRREPRLTFPKPPKAKNYTSWIIIIIIIAISAIIFYSIRPDKNINTVDKTKSDTTSNIVKSEDVEDVGEQDIKDENIDEQDLVNENSKKFAYKKKISKMPALLKKIEIIDSIVINDESLSGESQKKVRKKGAVLSEEQDPKIVAIVNAMIKRLALTTKVSTTKRNGITSKRLRGTFRGFKIDSQRKTKGSKRLTNKISVITPTRGQLSIINGVLYSVKKVKYDSFIKSLSKRGIIVIDGTLQDEQTVSLNLVVQPTKKTLEKGNYLMSDAGIFGINAGDGIEKLKLNLPAEFRVIKKHIEINENTSYNVYKVLNKEFNTLFFVKEWNGKIEKIEIMNTSFKTKEGIGINSTLGLMRIFFPDIKIAMSKDNLVVMYNNIGGYFILDMKAKDFVNHKYKDSSKVIEIVFE